MLAIAYPDSSEKFREHFPAIAIENGDGWMVLLRIHFFGVASVNNFFFSVASSRISVLMNFQNMYLPISKKKSSYDW